MFLFSSSLSVGSTFVDLVVEDDNPNADVVLVGPNRDPECENNFSGFFGLKNFTEKTIVAYYMFSNFQNNGLQKYDISPIKGFLVPGETV